MYKVEFKLYIVFAYNIKNSYENNQSNPKSFFQGILSNDNKEPDALLDEYLLKDKAEESAPVSSYPEKVRYQKHNFICSYIICLEETSY